MTVRLYHDDSYLRRFTAEARETGDGGTLVYLDRTAFYPTAGGQACDQGTLNGIPVIDVAEEEDRIAHRLEGSLSPGPVTGEIDWTRRFDHMQHHTGQHLLSAVFTESFGLTTVSVHLGSDVATVDLDAASVPNEILEQAERLANEEIVRNRPVTVSHHNADEVEGLRKASARTGRLRIVEIAGLDRSACGGTHVRATGEIGALAILGTEKIRQSTRVQFLCGFRVIRHARRESAARKAQEAEFQTRIAQLEKDRRKALQEWGALQGRDLYRTSPPRPDGRKVLIDERTEIDESARAIATAFVSGGRALYAVFAGDALLVAASPDSGWNAGAIVKAIAARGGGSAAMAQGSVSDRAAARLALEAQIAN